MPTKNAVTKSYSDFIGGPDRIRTGVEAFAELCLATRLQDHYFFYPYKTTRALPIRQLADTGPVVNSK